MSKREIEHPAGGLPAQEDIWQAANLLIGVYGRYAVEYADGRRCERQENGDLDAARTWHLIISQIENLLYGAPAARLH